MAITLGEIAVRLLVNSGEFISGFSTAGAATKRFRADLSDHIGAVGQVLERGLAQFGEFGASVGGILGQASSAAGQAILSFGKLGGSMGTIVGVGAGVAAGLAVAEVGIIGIAIHSAEGAAKLGEMSEKAGVSSQTLAGLALAGRGVGVETESLVKALGFMGANAVKAAISSDYAHTAFGRLGISVKDATGAMKDGGQLFTEIVGKIAALPTSEQGFFVKAIFGRGGIEILPLINKGVDGIREKMELAGKFGLGDPATVEAARKFKETVDDIKAGFEGVALELTKELLPSLQFLSEEILKAAKNGDLKILIHDMAELTRMTLGLVDTFKSGFEQIGLLLEYVVRQTIAAAGLIGGAIEAGVRFNIGDFSGAKKALSDSYKFFVDQAKFYDSESRKIWEGNADFINGIYGRKAVNPFAGKDLAGVSSQDLARGLGKSAGFASGLAFNADAMLASLATKTGSADLSVKGEGKEDTTLARINDRIDALHREAGAWAAIAAAGSQGESLIAKATEKANAEFAKQVDIADKDKTGRAQKRIAEAEATLKADVANTFYAETISKTNDDIAKETAKFIEQGKATDVLTASFQRGGAAISSAVIESKLESERAQIAKYTDALRVITEKNDLYIASRARLGAAIGPVQGEQADPTRVALLTNAIRDENAALIEQHRILQDDANKSLSRELGDQEARAKALRPAIDGLTLAYMRGEDAVRAQRIQLELANFAEDERRKGASEDAISAALVRQRALIVQKDADAYRGALAQQAAEFNLATQYDDQITRLERIKHLMIDAGQSTLGVEARIFDEQNRLLHQWDEWAFKVGTFKQKFTAVMGELVIQGRNAGSAIAGAFLTAIDGIETNLAKLLTGGKADFKAVFQNLAESVTKAEIQKGVGKLASSFGLKIPGLSPKADGSDGNPFYVILKNQAGANFAIGNNSNIPLFGAPGTTPGQSSGGIGGFFSGLLGAFSGFHASGGYIPSGGWGIAGEAGPEIIQGPASVTPAGPTYNITHNHNYPTAGSRDLFGRTQRQNDARQTRNSRLAYA